MSLCSGRSLIIPPPRAPRCDKRSSEGNASKQGQELTSTLHPCLGWWPPVLIPSSSHQLKKMVATSRVAELARAVPGQARPPRPSVVTVRRLSPELAWRRSRAAAMATAARRRAGGPPAPGFRCLVRMGHRQRGSALWSALHPTPGAGRADWVPVPVVPCYPRIPDGNGRMRRRGRIWFVGRIAVGLASGKG
jgi:hypothetical protein